MDAPTLHTERLTLRGFQPSDLDALAAIYADAEVARYLSAGVRTREQTATALDAYQARWRTQSYGVWAITLHEADDAETLLGMCGFVAEAELGYILARAAWGRGMATEAARACLRYGFEAIGWETIGAGALRANTASIHIIEKLGMLATPKAYFDENGGAWFTLRREHWRE